MAHVVPRPSLSTIQQGYVTEVAKGLWRTLKHARKALSRPEKVPTLNYPEVKPEIPRNYRSRHRLMKRPDGEPRCVACYMCAAACPANCIHIEAKEAENGQIEKKPAKFEIDLLVCIFCGLCEEACPVDAIRMDTTQAIMAGDKREKFVARLEDLLDWNPKDYPESDLQSQRAPGGTLNIEARRQWGMEEGGKAS